jgi:DNA-binding NtrC family response regulator
MSSGSRRVSGELVRAYGAEHGEAERELIAHGPRSLAIMQHVSELATSSRSVLITGETGTGKTVVAHALHAQIQGASPELRVINCAALSDALLADLMGELDTEPVFSEQTVLLDEIGELSPWGQAVLLHKLQVEAHPQRAPAQGRRLRFIAATHRNLDTMIAQGSFSRELMWRLNMARIGIEPLRARRDEIVPLALHFLRVGLQQAGTRFVTVDPDLFVCLEGYDWPGNVRELKNAICRTMAVNDGDMLGVTDLPDAVRNGPSRLCGPRLVH